MKGIFIDIKDIMIIRGLTKSGAQYLFKRIQFTLNKKPYQKISINEYCDYEGITIEQFLKAIK